MVGGGKEGSKVVKESRSGKRGSRVVEKGSREVKGGSRVVKETAKLFWQVLIGLNILHLHTKSQLSTPILG